MVAREWRIKTELSFWRDVRGSRNFLFVVSRMGGFPSIRFLLSPTWQFTTLIGNIFFWHFSLKIIPLICAEMTPLKSIVESYYICCFPEPPTTDEDISCFDCFVRTKWKKFLTPTQTAKVWKTLEALVTKLQNNLQIFRPTNHNCFNCWLLTKAFFYMYRKKKNINLDLNPGRITNVYRFKLNWT